MEELGSCLRSVARFGPNQVIFQEGDPGDAGYLIRDGYVDISVRRSGVIVLIGRLGPGEIFGELALLDDQPRAATATTAAGCAVQVITRQYLATEIAALDTFLQYWLSHLAHQIRRLLRQARRTGYRAPRIHPRKPAPLPAAAGTEGSGRPTERVWTPTLRRGGAVFDRRVYTEGQVVFREGEPGYRAFIVRTGRIEISKLVDGELRVLGEMRVNQIFGEYALVDDKPRSATATALEQTEVLVIEAGTFRQKIDRASPFIQFWIRTLIDRLRDMSDRVG